MTLEARGGHGHPEKQTEKGCMLWCVQRALTSVPSNKPHTLRQDVICAKEVSMFFRRLENGQVNAPVFNARLKELNKMLKSGKFDNLNFDAIIAVVEENTIFRISKLPAPKIALREGKRGTPSDCGRFFVCAWPKTPNKGHGKSKKRKRK